MWTAYVQICTLTRTFLCWAFMAQSTQRDHVKHGQFTKQHFYWTGLVLYAVNQYCAHSYVRNRQLPFLNQLKGGTACRKYLMINLHERMLPTLAGGRTCNLLINSRTHIQLSHWGQLSPEPTCRLFFGLSVKPIFQCACPTSWRGHVYCLVCWLKFPQASCLRTA